MGTAARQRTVAGAVARTAARTVVANGLGMAGLAAARPRSSACTKVFVAVENQEMEIAFSRIMKKHADVEIVGMNCRPPLDASALAGSGAEILLLASCGDLLEDLTVIRNVRATEPGVEIVMLGAIGEEGDFLQCVRAGVRGYLARSAGGEELLQAVRDVRAGSAVCPGKLCARLFRYFESEAKSVPSASIHQRMGLTRREQQLIPLVARGMTNKEIANHFSLSEQTVKNHLYRMKHKIGAEDRLSIVHLCRLQGFMV
jgi:DNA-binding NarL/FixJ family response regulator